MPYNPLEAHPSEFPPPTKITISDRLERLSNLNRLDRNFSNVCTSKQDVYIETVIERSADAGGNGVLRTYFCGECMEHVGSWLFGEGEEMDLGGGVYRFLKFREGGGRIDGVLGDRRKRGKVGVGG